MLRRLVCCLILAGCSESDQGNPLDGIPCDADADCADAFAELRPCEAAVCSDEGICAIGALPDGTDCRDGLSCTDPDYCLEGQCTGRTISCDDDDPCTADECDNKSGCFNNPLTDVPCDDDDPCTSDDTCVVGECKGGPREAGCCRFDGECDDDDPCTDDGCDEAVCVFAPNFAPCDDGDKCTAADHCDGAGGCGGDPLACEDGNPCTLDACDSATGACDSGPAGDGVPCEDGNPCTIDDACDAGLCISGESLCECTTDAECALMEDEDICNGTLVCTNLRCVVDPLSVVACNPTGDTACVQNTCDPVTGQCRPLATQNGAMCDDQNPCTTVDQCQNGLCLGVALSCDDLNPCTFDACSPVVGCQYTDNNLSCSDGSACTANDQCGGGVCTGVELPCDDDNPCTQDSCDGVGCRSTPKAGPCDDGDPCTGNDACDNGTCLGGGSVCTPCTINADCAAFDDGDKCNGTLVCVGGGCVADPATVVTCNTAGDTVCKKTRCVPATGVCGPSNTANGTTCSDGTSCTLQDACSGGNCVGAPVDCDDGNPCTTDSCDAALGCRNVPHSSACNDGNACTTGDVCSGGVCGGVLLVCNDGNECTVDSCDTLQGCRTSNAPSTTVCNDDTACTNNDRCNAGTCAGTAIVCADTNPCTQDLCVAANGCSFPATPPGGACDDGNACTGSDACSGGVCGGSAVVCDDGNDCTSDSCNPASGCQTADVPDDDPCEDGDACTDPDSCQNGQCVAGTQICTGCVVDGCPDPGQCKVATCNAGTGVCSVANSNEGGGCNDQNACTDSDKCTTGTCGGTAHVCEDNNACTDNTCAPATGCSFVNDNTNSCADTDLCDGTETCNNGTCQNGTALTCNDSRPCTDDTCAPATGCVFTNDNSNTCADVDLCDGTETCVGGNCQNGAPVNCNDNNACTTDACNAAGACTHTAIPGCAPDVTCTATPLTQTPNNDGSYDPVTLNGTLNAAGAGGVTYSWVVTSNPGGVSNAQPASPSSIDTTITPDIGGSYTLTLTATDSAGASDSCTVTFTAQVTELLRIELVWDETWGDADLHLSRPGAALPGAWFSATNDCWFDTCSNLNWGQNGPAGNPTLDRDDANGFGPENINIRDAPLETGTYTIAVSYYCEHSIALRGGQAESPIDMGIGPSDATVRVHCGGAVTSIDINLDETGQFIIVGTVTIPGCAVNATVNPMYVGDVQTGPGFPIRCDVVPGNDGHHIVPECSSDNDCLSGEYCNMTTFTVDVCYLETP